MTIVFLLIHFFAGGVEIRAIGNNDIVAAIGRGIPNWLVFSHEKECNARGETPERRWCDAGCDGGG